MKKHDNGVFLLHIASSFEKILLYVKDMTENEFSTNSLVQDAVVRNYEIIGEAAKNVSEEFRVQHPEIDWRGMAGFRDVLIHQYFGIDLINVWNISQNQAEKVLKQITALPEYGIAKANLSNKV